jgi:iron complex outermembrane receptor protein
MRCLQVAAAAALGLCAQSGAAHAPPSAAGLSRLSIEELADIEVSSVSKRPERLADAAAAVYVITHEDITRAGVLTIPEALRLAPNLQVARINSNSYAISARGSNNSSANKLLVMIDGRSVYTPLHSGVFWDMQDVMLEDVDRIEVISGPGGTLWGANAVNGVINIVTRSSQQTQGTFARISAGNDARGGALRHGWKLGEDTSLRAYAKVSRFEATHTASDTLVADAWNMNQLGFRSDGGRNGTAWTLQGDAYEGKAKAAGTPDRRVSGANLLMRWNRALGEGRGLQVQAYLDHYSRKQPGVFSQDLSSFDLDLQYHFPWGQGHELVWGGGVRQHHDSTTGSPVLAFVPADSRLRLINTFVQDTLPLGEHVKLTLGAKLEHNSYSGLEVQPSVRLAWKIDERRLLWSALSHAVRTPSRLDRDFHVFINLAPPYSGTLQGGPGFVAERLTAYELGYRAQPTPRTTFSVSAYYNDYDRLRSVEPAGAGAFVLGNKVALRAAGIEMWGSMQVSDNWRLSAGYNRLHERWRFTAGSGDPGSASAGGNDPRYQASLRSSLSLPRDATLDVGVRAVGALPNPAVPSYVALDARLGWVLKPGIELSLAGFNLSDSRHVEFGSGAGASHLGRHFLLGLSCSL